MVNDKILNRIQRLLALSGSDNKNEAANAYAAAQRLLTEHRISMAEVAAANGKPIASVWQKQIHQGGKRFTRWMTYLFNQLCLLNGCRLVLVSNPLYYHVFGSTEDIEIIEYLYNSIRGQVEVLCMLEMQLGSGFGKGWAANFKYGAVEMVIKRLKETKAQAEQKHVGSAAMVLISKQSEAVDAMTQLHHPRLTKSYSSLSHQPDARELGNEAGKRVTLFRGMKGGDSKGSLD